MARIGRLTFPVAMLAFPFYLRSRSPGKTGSHYDPKCDLFVPAEEPLVCPFIPSSGCNAGLSSVASAGHTQSGNLGMS